MPIICYRDKKFGSVALEAIEHANRIITDHQAQGYDLTLRQIYYQFVSHDLFPDSRIWTRDAGGKWKRDSNGTKNAEPNYDWLGELLNEARLAGLVDWDAMVDRTRNLEKQSFWSSPREIVETCVAAFRKNPWENQETYVEVWVEKDALEGVVDRVSTELRVPYFSCRGYTSQSSMWTAAQRLQAKAEEGKAVVIVHLGDHDPSGVDMTRDIQDRLVEFSNHADIAVQRVALTMAQVRRYNPPPNPAKFSDARYEKYVAEFGEECWELDALDLPVIHAVIEKAVRYYLDDEEWDRVIEEELAGQEKIRNLAKKLK